jgi:pimeloyl-ACP methyl ester carboxylesterase
VKPAAVHTSDVFTSFGSIHIAEAGVGPPLLLLHSSPNSHRDFSAVIPLLETRYRMIAPDTLGFGNSGEIPPAVSMENLADCMAEVLDARGIAKAHVYGFHTGNKIAAALADRHSARVEKLILAGMTHSLIDNKATRDAAIAPFAAKFLGPPRPAEVDERLWRSSGLIYRANFAFDLGAALRRIGAPTLLLEFATVAEDHFGHQAPGLAAHMKNATAVVLMDTGGRVHAEAPGRVAELIRGFLD